MTATVPIATVPGPNPRWETFAAESQFAAPEDPGRRTLLASWHSIAVKAPSSGIATAIVTSTCMAGICVASLGYSHPKYVAALQKQIARLHVGSFATAHRAELVKLIASVTPGDCNRTQFYSSGAEAVEAALRLAKSHTKEDRSDRLLGRLPRQDRRRPAAARRHLQARSRSAHAGLLHVAVSEHVAR